MRASRSCVVNRNSWTPPSPATRAVRSRVCLLLLVVRQLRRSLFAGAVVSQQIIANNNIYIDNIAVRFVYNLFNRYEKSAG